MLVSTDCERFSVSYLGQAAREEIHTLVFHDYGALHQAKI